MVGRRRVVERGGDAGGRSRPCHAGKYVRRYFDARHSYAPSFGRGRDGRRVPPRRSPDARRDRRQSARAPGHRSAAHATARCGDVSVGHAVVLPRTGFSTSTHPPHINALSRRQCVEAAHRRAAHAPWANRTDRPRRRALSVRLARRRCATSPGISVVCHYRDEFLHAH